MSVLRNRNGPWSCLYKPTTDRPFVALARHVHRSYDFLLNSGSGDVALESKLRVGGWTERYTKLTGRLPIRSASQFSDRVIQHNRLSTHHPKCGVLVGGSATIDSKTLGTWSQIEHCRATHLWQREPHVARFVCFDRPPSVLLQINVESQSCGLVSL